MHRFDALPAPDLGIEKKNYAAPAPGPIFSEKMVLIQT
jgi:hypothetical protein